MIEKALLALLIVFALVTALPPIVAHIEHNARTIQCAEQHVTICVYDRHAK